MAGKSARARASEQREKAARLLDSADRWERGADGENVVAAALADLEASGWTVLHDLAWPGRKYANIDHIAIGNGHVFVIDAKNWTGEVTTAGGVLRQNGRSRAKEVAAVSESAIAISGVVPDLPAGAVRPVLCLVREDWLSARLGSVMVCSSHNVVAQLRAQPTPSERPSPRQIALLSEGLLAHGTFAEARARTKPRAASRRTRHETGTGLAVKLFVALAAMAIFLTQPTWFTSAIDSVSEQFVSLFAPPPDLSPVDKSPNREQKRTKQGQSNDN